MRVVRVDEALPGSTVAKEILDLRGNLLYAAGTELTTAVLALLRARNVTHLFLEDDVAAAAQTSAPSGAATSEIDADLDRAFAEAASHPVMAELREAAKRYLKSRLQ